MLIILFRGKIYVKFNRFDIVDIILLCDEDGFVLIRYLVM